MKTLLKALRVLRIVCLLTCLPASAATLCVWQDSPLPGPPYDSWLTAATNIQDAVDEANRGDTILVAGGVYRTGGRAIHGRMTNRIAITKAITVESLMGPAVTIIQGYQVPGTTNGDGAIRCVYLTNGAVLNGFTLTHGATRCSGGEMLEQNGGGLWCESREALATNCIFADNSACYEGGGVSGGTLNGCTLTGNSAKTGGGASGTILDSCTLVGNLANEGGGAYGANLLRCTLAGNSAKTYGGAMSEGTLEACRLTGNSAPNGGGAAWCELYNCTLTLNSATSGGGAFGCTLNNCILYYNTADGSPNYSGGSLNYCCTTPLPSSGAGNIIAEPLFAGRLLGNLRLQTNSPCIDAGLIAPTTGDTDLDGRPRIVGGKVDMGAYESQGAFVAWLSRFGLPTDGSGDFADPDHDGLNNWQESEADTNPTNAACRLHIAGVSPGSPVSITAPTSTARLYTLLCCSNLTVSFWKAVPGQEDLRGNAAALSFTDTNPPNPAFYRVSVRMP